MYTLVELSVRIYEKVIETVLVKLNVFEFISIFTTNVVLKLNLLIPEILITSNMLDALLTAIKFLVLIAMLVFIRGGIPRYRYDFLTKIGWIKFLSLILTVFLSTLLFVYVM